MLGVLVIDKPLGITSHDVVNKVRRALGTRRVGHAGTLDPLATGVLVVAVGPATRFLQYLSLEPKVYEFEVLFGQETLTQDAEGEVVAEKPVPADLLERLEMLLPEFHGEIEQIPPMYSAVKKDGKPLYAYARQGKEVERESRQVFIEKLSVVRAELPRVRMTCTCSGGTYVRTLAHDLGQRLGCGAHLSELRRTQVGRFTLEEAVPLEGLTPDQILPLGPALEPLETVVLPPEIEARVRDGQRVPLRPVPRGLFVGMLDAQGNVIGVARIVKGSLCPECIIPREAPDSAV